MISVMLNVLEFIFVLLVGYSWFYCVFVRICCFKRVFIVWCFMLRVVVSFEGGWKLLKMCFNVGVFLFKISLCNLVLLYIFLELIKCDVGGFVIWRVYWCSFLRVCDKNGFFLLKIKK